MKKSSLGRRSSILGQGRLSNIDKSGLRNTAEGKKSGIPKPCFGSKNERSSSCDRDYMGSSVKKEPHLQSGLRRSRSFLDLKSSSTPCQTPTQFQRRMTAGSCRKFSEGGRASSIGAPKSARKESRPINDKHFQVDAQHKIQEFCLKNCSHLLEKGSIKPIHAAMFAELVNYLIQPYEKRIIVNKSNLVEEVLNICKLYNYKGKAEKSWLITVNAPHSWPYVVSFLLWLVEVHKSFESFEVHEALYPDTDEGDGENEMEEIVFKLLVPHLIKGYKSPDDSEEKNQFLAEYKEALDIDDKKLGIRQADYSDLQKQLNDMNAEDSIEEEKLAELLREIESVRNDIKNFQDFIYEAEDYLTNMNRKHKENLSKFEEYERVIEILKKELNDLRTLVSSQEISPEDKQKIEDQIATLRREIKQYKDEIADYQSETYKADIELVRGRNELNKFVQLFNKEITINLVKLPTLKNAQIEDDKIIHMDAPNADKRMETVDYNLKELKIALKNQIRDLEMEIQTAHLNLQKNEDQVAQFKEERDKLLNQVDQLEHDIKEIKNLMVKEKEQGNVLLCENKQKIKTEKENLELRKDTLGKDVIDATNKYMEMKRDADQHVTEGLHILASKKEQTYKFQHTLEEITRRRLDETKKKLKELENNKQ